MKNRFLVAILLAVLVAAIPIRAQAPGKMLKYTSRMDLVKSADAGAGSEMGEMMAGMLKQVMFPNGPIEMDYASDGQSVRAELHAQMANMPKGSVILYLAGKADGVVLNPVDKTFFTLKAPVPPPEAAAILAQMKPVVTTTRSGTFETIQGYKAEKVDTTVQMQIPLPQGVEPPPGIPSEFVMTIESWCAPDVKLPTAASQFLGMATRESMPGFNMEDLAKACPFPLRSRMRMSMMPGWEMSMSVVSPGEVDLAPDLFKMPEGYKEVAPPKIGG